MKKNAVSFEQWGMAAAIPGLQMAIDQLQERLDEIRALLNGEAKKPGRPPGPSEKQKNYWAKMTPEERSQEAKRRHAVARAKAAPKTEEAIAQKGSIQNGAAQKAYWATMTPQQRKNEMKRRARVSEKNGSPMIGAKTFSPGEAGKTVQ